MLECFDSEPTSLKLVRELEEPIEHDYSLEILHKMSDEASSSDTRYTLFFGLWCWVLFNRLFDLFNEQSNEQHYQHPCTTC